MTFLPYLSGERTPHNDAAIRGAFAGLGHDTDRAALTQAVLEGVAFAFRDCLRRARRRPARSSTACIAVGGGSRSRYWLKAIATALGMPVDVPADGDFGARLRRRAPRPDAPPRAPIPSTSAQPPAIGETIEPDAGARCRLCRSLRALPRALPRHQGGSS